MEDQHGMENQNRAYNQNGTQNQNGMVNQNGMENQKVYSSSTNNLTESEGLSRVFVGSLSS